MDFDLSPDERAFEAEVEAVLEAEHAPDVMDPNPEQLSQTVDSPAKRAFMKKLSARGWLGMSWPKEYGGQERPGIYDFVLTEALSRHGAPQPGKGVGLVVPTLLTWPGAGTWRRSTTVCFRTAAFRISARTTSSVILALWASLSANWSRAAASGMRAATVSIRPRN